MRGTRTQRRERAVGRAADRLLVGDEVEHVDRRRSSLRREPDDASCPPGRIDVDAEPHRVGRADGDDRPVEAVARGRRAERPDGGLVVGRVERRRWRRTRGRARAARRTGRTPRSRRRPATRAPWIALTPTPPHADHRSRGCRPRRRSSRSPRRAPVITAQPTSAATSAGTPSGQRDAAALRDDGVLGEAAEQRSTSAIGPSCPRIGEGPVVSRPSPIASSESWQRIGRPTTQWRQRPQPGARLSTTRLARRDRRHARPDGLDDARALVAEHRRERETPTRRRPGRRPSGTRRRPRRGRAPRRARDRAARTRSIEWGSRKARRTAALVSTGMEASLTLDSRRDAVR